MWGVTVLPLFWTVKNENVHFIHCGHFCVLVKHFDISVSSGLIMPFATFVLVLHPCQSFLYHTSFIHKKIPSPESCGAGRVMGVWYGNLRG